MSHQPDEIHEMHVRDRRSNRTAVITITAESDWLYQRVVLSLEFSLNVTTLLVRRSGPHTHETATPEHRTDGNTANDHHAQ